MKEYDQASCTALGGEFFEYEEWRHEEQRYEITKECEFKDTITDETECMDLQWRFFDEYNQMDNQQGFEDAGMGMPNTVWWDPSTSYCNFQWNFWENWNWKKYINRHNCWTFKT